MHELFNWFEHAVGMTNGSDAEYLFWSGFGADISEITLVAGIWMVLKQHNCHVKGCWRLGHSDPVHGWPACKKHHSMGELLG